MARRSKPMTVKVTQKFIPDPQAVELGIKTWAMFLADQLQQEMADESDT